MAYEAVILRCSASSHLKPAILWMYDGTFSFSSGATVDSLNVLTILSANTSHSGSYTCNVADAFSSSQTRVTVHVKYPETCSKVKTSISEVSGDYLIDPDGVLGGCTCSLTRSCDQNDQKWREDSGFLTIKSHLPVKQLRFGDTGGRHEKGYHTLGKLECYGLT